MKLSFSTRGWSDCTWDELVDASLEMGFAGIEVYDLFKQQNFVGKGCAFDKYNTRATARALRDKKLTLPVFDSSVDISLEGAVDEAKRLIDVAGEIHVEYVCFKAQKGEESVVKAALDELVPYARALEVTILMETSGIYGDTARLTAMLDEYASDYLAALWDIHHPYRDNGEQPADTIKNLGAYVKHVHMRDSDDDGTYNLVGEGTMPLDSFVLALSSIDYDGFVSLEWKPEWMEDLTDMDIILPHFVNYMERFEDTRGKRRTMYLNHDGTGEYLWKKDELIDLTFPQVLDRMVEAFPNQYAFKYTTLDYTRTYEEFRDDVDNFARALVSMGVKPGSKVAIWATNVPAWYITFWAATKIGAVLVTVNTAYKVYEAEYLLRQSDTHTLVMIESALDSNYREIINELCPEIKDTKPGEPLHCKRLPFLRNVITVGFDMPGCLNFDQAFDRAELVPLEKIQRMADEVRPNDVCNMQYTSGTTGFPKGVMLTHRNVVNDGKCIGDRMGLSTADRMMIQVPMFHCFGMTLSMTSSMTHGATMCPMPYFSAKASLSCITQERITCFNGVPTMFIAMFNHPDYRKTDFSHMRTGIMAGSGCPPELMKKAAQPDEMNMTGIVSVYGQTESSPGSVMTTWTDPLDWRTETVGYEYPHIQCKVINPYTGEEMPDGHIGEFCSRGYNTMKGYYKMPDATAKTVDADGWLHSGDLVMRDENGNFRVTGRLKDMIIRGGENIYPKEIEDFLITHPKVSDAQVIGVPDKKYGEEAMACIILMEGEEMTEDEIREFIKTNIARHKVPRYIKFVDSFPMNAAGKILKYKMREAAVEELGLQDIAK
ncbi:Short-chain-fatty-acid--CoA ligase [Slackia heliotrinireducens]|uniref:Acyl-CoA synthetase (AMP-forming)/AMP-acid ligase II n=1 Tax=Slackia heliotrinireducens (strain ATCC 29202 / DSM 20476 / NCTC 11029 / RHS 1) TaxID=471855 RepID=C7N749_SLAHD|nr:AMP-binding protein [Slackia heliotrinireducens]ACV22734.1 acyl-CoA synthetase (AMP-forming)/AMP-acid ligase II [Slackia heliotrinireducens DSM 20476]VEH01374.1 Short-chain-fatty-acid--CoA ligase [Slackia heliotrinireducens]